MRAAVAAALVVGVVALAAVGCGGEDQPAKPRSREEAAAACTKAIDDVIDAVIDRRERYRDIAGSGIATRVACADLYRRPACARAWTRLATPSPTAPAPLMSVEQTTAACAQAYCRDLAEPRPRGCADAIQIAIGDESLAVAILSELDERILVLEGFAQPVAIALAGRAQVFRARTFANTLESRPGRSVHIDILPTPARTFVEVSVTTAAVHVDGATVDDAGLRTAVAAAVARAPRIAVRITADDAVEYHRIVAIMDLVKAAGASDIVLGTQ